MSLLLSILTILLIAAVLVARMRPAITHRWRRRQARTMCAQLRGRDRGQPGMLIYARLRAMDPLAFEELLLEAFRLRGHGVVRNRCYTGDGGIDGQVVIAGRTWLIQAKRYQGVIRPQHVEAFAGLCAARAMPGLFIHTGRTGGATRDILVRAAHIEIISGPRLLGLLTGGPLVVGTELA